MKMGKAKKKDKTSTKSTVRETVCPNLTLGETARQVIKDKLALITEKQNEAFLFLEEILAECKKDFER